MGILDAALNLVDVVPSMGRDTAAAVSTGDWQTYNPLDQLASPLSSRNGVQDGRELLRIAGVLDPQGEDTWGNFAAGLAADVATDPITWIPGLGLGTLAARKIGKGGASRALDFARRLNRDTRGSLRIGGNAPLSTYSRLDRAIQALPPRPIKAESALNMIRKYPEGVNAEEIEWSGLREFLKGRQKVAPEELIQARRSARLELHTDPRAGQYAVTDSLVGRPEASDPAFPSKNEAEKYLANLLEEDPSLDPQDYQVVHYSPTHYESYGLPTINNAAGNYQEHLFTLPEAGEGYQSPHWENIDDIVFHVRTSDAPTASVARRGGRTHVTPGEKPKDTLFVEEIQSDLHQEGRDYGYRGAARAEFKPSEIEKGTHIVPGSTRAISKTRDGNYVIKRAPTLDEIANDVVSLRRMAQTNPELYSKIGAFDDKIFSMQMAEGIHEDYDTSAKLLKELESLRKDVAEEFHEPIVRARIGQTFNQYQDFDEAKEVLQRVLDSTKPPNYPYKKDWPRSAMHEMIVKAVNEDKDRVAWSGGDLAFEMVGGKQEGQRNFYDGVLKRIADKLIKKNRWNTKIQRVGIPKKIRDEGLFKGANWPRPGEFGRFFLDDELARKMGMEKGEVLASYRNLYDALSQPERPRELDEFANNLRRAFEGYTGSNAVGWGFDITPEMKADIIKKGGLPMLSLGGLAVGLPGIMNGESNDGTT